jgi:hypothetical protein
MTAIALLRAYFCALGALLLGQGTLSVVLERGFGVDLSSTHGLLMMDDRHSAIHIVWGLGLLTAIVLRVSDRTLAQLGLLFAVFYVSLTFLGIFGNHPLGLMLGYGQNAFHAIISALAIVLLLLHARRTPLRERLRPAGDG